ncbi:MAG: DUF3343 domain-containing protein [Syntrophobacterales bacterium]|nr:DUF3343 domain-containing protein [Syntrophobacterales bacterium]
MSDNREHSYYLIYKSIHDVLKAEKKLKERGFNFELIPIPRNLSSDCGSCIRLYDQIEDVTNCADVINMEKCFFFDGKDFKPFMRQ